MAAIKVSSKIDESHQNVSGVLTEVMRLLQDSIAENGKLGRLLARCASPLPDRRRSTLFRPQTGYYADLAEIATALFESLLMNHPFVDGNKRVGHAAMETFLMLNGVEINASTDEQEEVVLALATGALGRERLVGWLQAHVREV